jgi:hypothetical protein
MRLRPVVLFCVLCIAFLSAPASAGVLYDNGAPGGTAVFGMNMGYYGPNTGWFVTDAFTLTNDSIVTGAQVGLWVIAGNTLQAVDWEISTSNAFDGSTALASGTASLGTSTLTNTFLFATSDTGGDQFAVISSQFPTGSLSLTSGTYWLLLTNGQANINTFVGWDQNSGPSDAYAHYFQQSGMTQIPSESFQILGTTTGTGAGTPEPGSLTLFGLGAIVLTGALRRKRSRSR